MGTHKTIPNNQNLDFPREERSCHALFSRGGGPNLANKVVFELVEFGTAVRGKKSSADRFFPHPNRKSSFFHLVLTSKADM